MLTNFKQMFAWHLSKVLVGLIVCGCILTGLGVWLGGAYLLDMPTQWKRRRIAKRRSMEAKK